MGRGEEPTKIQIGSIILHEAREKSNFFSLVFSLGWLKGMLGQADVWGGEGVCGGDDTRKVGGLPRNRYRISI